MKERLLALLGALAVFALFALVGHFDYEAAQATADPQGIHRR